jgi:O-antigen/teichoic acid export membrane protein
MIRLDEAGRASLVGGLMREQGVLLRILSLGVVSSILVLWLARVIETEHALLIASATIAAWATLMREYLRMVLFAYRRPNAVLRADVGYVAGLLAGVALAVLSSEPAIFTVLAIAAAATISSILLARVIPGRECWTRTGKQALLRTFAPLGAWSVSGAAAHWVLSQGYGVMVASVLSVQAVAAIAGTRLILMPLNLVSAGLGTQLFPLTADWVHSLGVLTALRRLAFVSIALVVFALCYVTVVWCARDWIFTELLQKQFAQRDTLLLLWSGAFVLMLVRDQLVKLLAARERLPLLAKVTVCCAALSLAAGYGAVLRFGETGAVAGIVVGELANIVGIAVLTFREIRSTVPATA